jgi:hypothetical protein
MARVEAAVKPPKDAEYAELIVDKTHVKQIPSETVWAKIGDNGGLEVIRWDIIEMYAKQYDIDNKNRSQSHVMCKLLVLVRDQTRKECGEKVHEAN